MKSQTTIAPQSRTLNNTVINLMKAVRTPLMAVANYYGRVLEREISIRQTLCLLNVQMAFVMTVFTGSALLVKLLCLVWFVSAVLRCKREL